MFQKVPVPHWIALIVLFAVVLIFRLSGRGIIIAVIFVYQHGIKGFVSLFEVNAVEVVITSFINRVYVVLFFDEDVFIIERDTYYSASHHLVDGKIVSAHVRD